MVIGLTVNSCLSTAVELARKKGEVYERVTSVSQKGMSGADKVVRAELDPGEFHVVKWTCHEAGGNTVLGKEEAGVYKKSFGWFEVRPGEIVNVGSLTLILVAPGVVHLAASDIPASVLEPFKEEFPSLAARMQTRVLGVPVPRLPKDQMAAFCARINQIHHTFRLPPYGACIVEPPPEAIINPARPALWQ